MKIWYDVSDLVGWKLPHLTGIQRATVGILNGLVDSGEPLGLVRYDARAGLFRTVSETELPASVRCHLHGGAAAGAGVSSAAPVVASPSAPAGRRQRRGIKLFKKEFLLGPAGESADLRHAFRQFKTAARHLRKTFGRWAGRRLRSGRFVGKGVLPPAMTGRAPTPAIDRDAAPFAVPGDVIVSLGATWVMPGHTDAIAAARTRGVKAVRMIYDLIPTIKPHWLDPSHTRAITAWVRRVLCESDHVLTISEFSRQEIERYCEECRFDVPPLTVVRLGDVMQTAGGGKTPPPLPRFAPARPFFVCVSTLDVRKNHRLLYDAWTHLAARRGDDCPDLLCIGTPHLYVAELLREIRQDRTVNRHIHVLHGIEDCELDWYYKNCQATIYPSKYEGWGLPVAESLGHGRLCLASNATSIPEISGDLPEFFDPNDVHAVVGLVERVLDDPNWVREREETIRASFRPTAWHDTATQVFAALAAQGGRGRLVVWPDRAADAGVLQGRTDQARASRAA